MTYTSATHVKTNQNGMIGASKHALYLLHVSAFKHNHNVPETQSSIHITIAKYNTIANRTTNSVLPTMITRSHFGNGAMCCDNVVSSGRFARLIPTMM